MSKVIIDSHAAFEAYLGKEIGVSDYLTVTQSMINQFADATLDHQWIHINEEKAKNEGPFGSTIAHGYLALSVAPHLWGQIVEVQNLKMMINYGIEKLRFNQAVLVNSDVRMRVKLDELADLRGITRAKLDVTLEIKDVKKAAFTATLVFLYHFNK